MVHADRLNELDSATLMETMKRTHILLVDDHALFRSGIALVLSNGLSDVCLHEAACLADALQFQATPQLVMLDLQLPDVSGLESISVLRARWPQAQLVVVSATPASDVADAAMALGARAFVSKSETPQYMLSLIGPLLGEGSWSAAEPPVLTPRQLEVLNLLFRGLSNKMIGRQLGLSENTVRNHVQALLMALKVSSRSEAAFQARRLGLVK